MQFVTQSTFDGTRLAVLDEGAGPAIVLIHGVLLAKETWDAQAAALARHARVVRIDLRGHGASGVPPGPYLMETLAGDVLDVLDALGIERATIVGHSLGGYVTFAFYRMFAERCAALGFVSTRAAADDAAGVAAVVLAVGAIGALGPLPDVACQIHDAFGTNSRRASKRMGPPHRSRIS